MGNIRRQGIINTFVSYLGIGIGFLNLIVLQPFMLKAEEFGLTRIMYSCTLVIAALFPAGLNLLTTKYFPRFRDKKNVHNGYLGVLLLFGTVGYLVVSLLIFLFKGTIIAKYSNSPLFVEYFYYVFPISFCIGFTSIVTTYCNSLFKTSVPSFINDVYLRFFMTIILSLYYVKIISFPLFMFLYFSSFAAQLILLLFYIKYIKAFSLKINWAFFKTQPLREIFKFTALLFLANLSALGIRNIDVLLIGGYLSLDAVAVYVLGMTIGALIELPLNSFGRIIDSKISDAIQRDDMKMVKEVYNKSVKLMILIGGVFFVLLYANINEAVLLLLPKYHEAKWVIIIIGFSAFINMATGVNSSIIYFSHKYVAGTYLLFAMIVISVVLNMLLIPIYGIEGSASATAIAMILYNIAKFFLIKKHFKIQPYDMSTLKVLLTIAVCIGVGVLIPVFGNKIVLIAVRSIILTALFIVLILGMKVVSLKEIKSLYK